MASGPKLVALPTVDEAPARVLVNGMDVVAVAAGTDADAIAAAKAVYDGDSDALWDDATVTDIAAAANMLGWRLHIKVTSPAGVDKADITVTGASSDDTIDEIAALAVIALNATAAIAGAAYDSGTQVLTIAETTDNLGDHHTVVEWFPPAADVVTDVAVPGFVVSTVDEGAAGAALTATFPADAYAVPKVYARLRKVR